MELVPIIEMTLSIFTGLFLLTVIISYIAFKMKKTEKEVNPAFPVNLASQPQIQPVIYSNQSYAERYPGEQYYINQTEYDESLPEVYIPSADYIPAKPAMTVSEEKNNNSKPASKFTVLNDVSPVKYGYIPETTKSFNHKFAPSKAKDAFAMFK